MTLDLRRESVVSHLDCCPGALVWFGERSFNWKITRLDENGALDAWVIARPSIEMLVEALIEIAGRAGVEPSLPEHVAETVWLDDSLVSYALVTFDDPAFVP